MVARQSMVVTDTMGAMMKKLEVPADSACKLTDDQTKTTTLFSVDYDMHAVGLAFGLTVLVLVPFALVLRRARAAGRRACLVRGGYVLLLTVYMGLFVAKRHEARAPGMSMARHAPRWG